MLFKVDPIIFQQFPGTVIGVVAAHGIKNSESNKQVLDLLKHAQERIRAQISHDQIKEHPHIAPWREAYKKFGVNPKKYMPSVENLVTRIAKGVPFGSVNTLVDLYNVVSINYLIPAGGEDLSKIKGDIELTIAGEHEKPVVLLGDKEAKVPHCGEVFYKDENGAICRRWNWKEADRAKLNNETTDAIFVLEGLPPVSKKHIEMAANALATLIEEYCGGEATVSIIDDTNKQLALRDNGAYLSLNPKKVVPITYEPKNITKKEVDQQKEASEQNQVRVEKVTAMKEAGLKAWPEFKPINATTKDVQNEFKDDQESREYEIAGRLVSLRGHGKTMFGHIQDPSGTLQIYIRKDMLGDEAFDSFDRFADVGDILWIKGHSFKTKMGEITLKASEVTLLSKSLHPLPEKFHGLADVETKYRQRYLDLISNAESRERFIKRSTIIREIRNYLNEHECIEVETPMLHPIPGGAVARPFVTHHNALSSDFYLRIAPELYLKRLVVGGMERVFEINRSFRNEGISTRHNPEFTMVEIYIAHKDYQWMMDFSQAMIQRVVKAVNGDMMVQFGDHQIDFSQPFERISMRDAVIKYAGISDAELADDAIEATLKKHDVSVVDNASWGQKLFELFDQLVESKLIQPTFITHFPVEISPLAKRDPEHPDFVSRFEMFIAGMELANAFNELNDPFDQAERFKAQAAAKDAGDAEAHHYDAEYVTALEYAMPPTVGYGMGIDRLTMLITNTTSIKDVILFPTLKKK